MVSKRILEEEPPMRKFLAFMLILALALPLVSLAGETY